MSFRFHVPQFSILDSGIAGIGMSINDLASTTRVFVSGLPPSLTAEDLRTFFGQKFSVTDAHVLPDRRIGFVGLVDHDSAERAAKYFNKTFIRMSKISVELAKPVDVMRRESGQAAPVSQRTFRDHTNNVDVNMKARKRKRDSDDNGEAHHGRAQLLEQNGPRTAPQQQILRELRETVTASPGASDNSRPAVKTNLLVSTIPTAEIVSDEPKALASDSDWLRGKTSRVLDLEEPANQGLASQPEIHLPDNPELSDAEGPTRGADVNAEDASSNLSEDEVQISNGRLFFRNLAFSTTENDLRNLLNHFGNLEEVHLVKDSRSSKSKGIAFVKFRDADVARTALQALDGSPFQGRLLHILPASDKREQKLSEFEISKLPLKRQKEIRRKANASTASFSWNSLYMNPDAVLASVAERLGVDKSDLLDPSSTDAAVKQARAETSIIQETKDYLRSQGINVDSFKNGKRHDRALLLKNFPFGTTLEELTAMLLEYGALESLIFPPTGTMAIALFEENHSAQRALKSLAYMNVKGALLYLEKAPEDLFQGHLLGEKDADAKIEDPAKVMTGASSTVFVRNLNFATTTARLTEVFKPLTGFLSAKVKTRTDATRQGEVLSMGFGFVEFRTKQQALAAVTTMHGHRLDGHEVLVQISNKTLDAAEDRRKEDRLKKGDQGKTKLIVKNLPFEASKKDIKSLLGAYGNLRSVRMPKKFDNTTRGFAFAEFVTAKEARNAMEALSSTHLLGRRLVLDFAESEIDDPEETIRAMEKKAGRQSHLTAVNKLISGSARKKFTAEAREDEPT